MKTLRILLANDSEVVRDGLRSLLQNYDGWEICGEAANGLDAVDKAVQLKPDLVIMDVGMPQLDSYLQRKDSEMPVAEQDMLTRREREVVQLVSEGKTTKEVASMLGISIKTAETHRSNIMRKLDIHSVTQLVLYALRHEIIPLWPLATASV